MGYCMVQHWLLGIPITLLRWMIHWLIFKFFGGRVRRKKIRHNRGLELKRKAQIHGIWGVLHMHYIEETEKGVWWRWVSTKIWVFRGSFETEEEEQISYTIAHKSKKEKELTSAEISLGVCRRWVLGIWRRKCREGKRKRNSPCYLFQYLVCVCGDKEDKIVFWVKGEKRGHARETTTLLTYAGCGLHQKVKKLSAE